MPDATGFDLLLPWENTWFACRCTTRQTPLRRLGFEEPAGVAFTLTKPPCRKVVSEKVNPDHPRVFVTSKEGFCPPGAELRFGKEVSAQPLCFCGEIGKHDGLKYRCRKACGFESRQKHQRHLTNGLRDK